MNLELYLHGSDPCTGTQAERHAPEVAQRFEIQMSTSVWFISGELLLRKVVDAFQKSPPASCVLVTVRLTLHINALSLGLIWVTRYLLIIVI